MTGPILVGQMCGIITYILCGLMENLIISLFINKLNDSMLSGLPKYVVRKYEAIPSLWETQSFRSIVLWPCYQAWVLGYLIGKNIFLIYYSKRDNVLKAYSLIKTFSLH